jgi:type I restriction enzyme S subunit
MASVKDMTRWGIEVKLCRTIAPCDFEDLVRNGCQPQFGDVLIAKDGATCLDTVCEYKQSDKIVLLSSIAILRPSKRLHSGYLRYYLDSSSTRKMLKAGFVSGSAIPRVVLKDFRRAPIPLPPFPIQRRIAHILGTLDDKIELNRRMNTTLEEMARALFKSWFVDFDPVRAKQAGKQPAGMDAETAALFPDAIEESELGQVPRGWRVMTVGDIGNVICGKTPTTSVSDYYGDDIPFITIPDMHGNVFSAATARKLSHAGANSQSNKILPPGSLCVSCIATPGLVVITSEHSHTNQQINSVIPHQKNETYFWYWVMTGLGAEIASSGSGGSVLVNLSKSRFEALKVIDPPKSLIRTYHNAMTPFFETILANTHQSRTLATLRDTLLPKLLSGELPVPDAEKIVERTV